MFRGPPAILEVCPCGFSKKTEEKIYFNSPSHTIGENLRAWKLLMAMVFHFFHQYLLTFYEIYLPAYRLPTLFITRDKRGL